MPNNEKIEVLWLDNFQKNCVIINSMENDLSVLRHSVLKLQLLRVGAR